MMNHKEIMVADLFSGAGGGTTGMFRAAQKLKIRLRALAINHNAEAIATHKANHHEVEHRCENFDAVWPRLVVPGGKLHLALFAPECPHHSKARGAKPMNEQSRATAWHVIRWAEELDIENILVENVEEFLDWGPLHPLDHPDPKLAGRPIKARRGEYFGEWLRALKRRGYKCEHRVLNSAYFGAATSRPRFFLQAKKIYDGKRPRITWPEPTHAPKADIQLSLFGDIKPFRGASEIIDWDVPGESIFDRKWPLCFNTMRRIFAGVEKFAGLPFLVPYYTEKKGQTPRTHAIDEPMPTVCARGNTHALCRPYLVVLRRNADARSLEEPVPTICAEARNHFYMAQPFLTQYFGGKDGTSLEKPLGTVTANYEHYALTQPMLEPYFVSYKGTDGAKSVHDPLATLTSRDRFALLRPFVSSMEHTTVESGDSRRVHTLDHPLPTVTGRGAFGLLAPIVLPPEGVHRGNAPRDVMTPLQTITSRGGGHLLQPFLVRYNGNSNTSSVDEPLPTVTTRDRFGLIHPQLLPVICEQHDGHVEVVGVLDILYRMLLKRELSAAMGFPKTYIFHGNDSQVKKQIGNAIAVEMAEALCHEMLKGYAPETKKRRNHAHTTT